MSNEYMFFILIANLWFIGEKSWRGQLIGLLWLGLALSTEFAG